MLHLIFTKISLSVFRLKERLKESQRKQSHFWWQWISLWLAWAGVVTGPTPPHRSLLQGKVQWKYES